MVWVLFFNTACNLNSLSLIMNNYSLGKSFIIFLALIIIVITWIGTIQLNKNIITLTDV